MNIIQEKLVKAYTTLVMAKRMTLEEIPEHKAIGGNEHPIRSEVEIEIAQKTIKLLD